jgi:hypothetical protein
MRLKLLLGRAGVGVLLLGVLLEGRGRLVLLLGRVR